MKSMYSATLYRIIFRFVIFLGVIVASVSARASTPGVGQFQAIDIPVPHSEQGVKNVWDDVSVTMRLGRPGAPFPDTGTSPIHGFYHSKDLWMVRYAPDQLGTWHYSITVTDRGVSTVIKDSFQCTASLEPATAGFIRLDENYKSWRYSGSGKPFYGIGFGDCMGTPRDSILENGGIDGGYRPPGYHTGIEWNIPYSQYLMAYGDAAGFNLYRYSDGNCAYSMVKQIATSGNSYDTLHCRWTDTLFTALRAHGFRIYMTILASPTGNSSDSTSMSGVKRYAQFCIDRFGPLVDFWELTNESNPDSLWVSEVATYIQQHDPYQHLVSMSNQMPSHPAISIISPHWYGREDVRSSDQVTADQINQYKDIKKPVIFGEQGEAAKWDSLSPTRMRGRIWSALFNLGSIIFWNSAFAKDCPCNQYLGWPERRSVRVMQNFARLLYSPYGMAPSKSTIGGVNVWQLGCMKFQALYLRNDQDVNAINSGLQVPIRPPAAGQAIWYDVHTGDIVGGQAISAGATVLTAPNFQTDIALIAGAFDSSLEWEKYFRLDVNPRTFEALSVPVNTQLSFPVTLTNTGSDTITIYAFTSSPSSKLILQIPMWKKAPRLAPGERMEIPIGYRMLDTGGAAAMLSIEHSASPAWENIAIDVSAKANAGVDPAAAGETANTLRAIVPDPASNFIIVPSVTSVVPNEPRGILLMEPAADDGSSAITAQILSISGTKVREVSCHVGEKIDVSGLAAGTYHLTLLNGGREIGSSVFVLFR
jgi:hypothetical protein